MTVIQAAAPAAFAVVCSAWAFSHFKPLFHVRAAIGRKDRMPRISHPPIRAIRFGEKTTSAGVQRHVIDKVESSIFDPARTIATASAIARRPPSGPAG